ncbi:uncharacterized protein N7487_006740 [Penicillium crustosum]|uniref:uncharacterized protein n=1 Tax=Penicillium crustosum TaxID=36656 RepID=UPI00238F8C7A|nr:uncharacterized protein N7487_006740 [Penicillium crustosum]KAJ5412381.1 hypothetical protein N7487_006740 [Penicillium crustosum]
MFYQNGKVLQEPEYNSRTTIWVNVFFNAYDYRCDDLAIMRTVITCIRTRVASITTHAMHHDIPFCISIQVPGGHGDRESILAAAEVSAEDIREQIASGSVRINRALLFQR